MSDASARQVGAAGAVAFAAEAQRAVLVLIDQASIARGEERAMAQAASLFLDRLGLDDRIAVLGVPVASDARVALTTERAETRLALSRIVGLRAAMPDDAAPAAAPPVAAEPDRMTGLDPERPVVINAATEAPRPAPSDSVAALRAVFESFRQTPGRKVVALFSAGLPSDASALVEAAAAAAVEARVAVHAFGVRSGGAELSGLATAPLERLAAATGGAFVALGKNPERAVERTVRELSACYVLAIEPAARDARAARHTLRIETTRKGVSVRSAAWLAAVEDTGDRVPDADRAGPAGMPPTDSVPASTPERRPARDGELEGALARLFEYADAYERQYAMLVAEEDYKQSAPKGSIRLRSDLLLVRPAPDEEWMSFRDVFEVDGRPVRDREDRLRRLFLEGTPEAVARMRAITDESARYNLGVVGRSVNVPLLPVSFLRPTNRGRFEYRLDGRDEAAGVEVLRIRYTEWARPTIVGDGRLGDQPVFGSFLVDAITGAIVESRMEARRDDSRAEIVVRYRRDPGLGLWVPAEMKELYSVPDSGSSRWSAVLRTATEGRATYSNFRRFQVKTEEKITPPK